MGKKLSILLALLMIIFLATACNKDDNKPNKNDKLVIITTLFPQYDFAKNIVKEMGEVSLLLPPGMEAHAYEPTPKDIADIKKADIFIYTGEVMEPWAHKIVENIINENLIIIDASKNIVLLNSEEDPEDENGESLDNHNHSHETDPHIWLDPNYAAIMVDNIAEGIIKADSLNTNYYEENARIYKDELKNLDIKLAETFKKTKSKTIIYAGHFAFGYFAKRYDLSYISPYKGFTADAEPTPQRIGKIINTINETGLKVIYYEELIDPKVARVISKETGAKMYLLHGAHNITKEELKSEITYIQIMEENLEKLKEGLGYEE